MLRLSFFESAGTATLRSAKRPPPEKRWVVVRLKVAVAAEAALVPPLPTRARAKPARSRGGEGLLFFHSLTQGSRPGLGCCAPAALDCCNFILTRRLHHEMVFHIPRNSLPKFHQEGAQSLSSLKRRWA